jgi:DNA-directed RNA polymerase beta subunit
MDWFDLTEFFGILKMELLLHLNVSKIHVRSVGKHRVTSQYKDIELLQYHW